eukprot:scaffold46055_cov56-Cyclotella_meneghiniana.AAC.5
MILQRYSLGETIFEVPRTNFTYREVEGKVPRKYRQYRENTASTASTAKSRDFRGSRYACIQGSDHSRGSSFAKHVQCVKTRHKGKSSELDPKVGHIPNYLDAKNSRHEEELDEKRLEVMSAEKNMELSQI